MKHMPQPKMSLEILRRGSLFRAGSWMITTIAPEALGKQSDGSVMRLSFAVQEYEYVRGNFKLAERAVTGGIIAALGPPQKVPSQYLLRKDMCGRGGAGMIMRKTRLGMRAGVYVGEDGSADLDLVRKLLSGVETTDAATTAASTYEQLVSDALRAANLEFDTQGNIPSPVPGKRNYRIDFRILSLGLVIEVDGEYHFPGPCNIPLVERDVYKMIYLEAHGERVLRIAYSAINDFCAIPDLADYLSSLPRDKPSYMPDTEIYSLHRRHYALARADTCAWLSTHLSAICGRRAFDSSSMLDDSKNSKEDDDCCTVQ